MRWILLFLSICNSKQNFSSSQTISDNQDKRQHLLQMSSTNPQAKNMTQTSLGYFAVCALAKDEHSSIREWIQYHLFKGVSKIYLFDNGSIPPMITLIHDFIKSDQVEYHYFTNSYLADDFDLKNMFPSKGGMLQVISCQLWVYNNCMKWFGHRHQFVGLFDIDEFLVLDNLTQTFPEYLKDFENFGGVRVYRQFFGSSGYIQPPNGTVLESYTKCTPNITVYKKQKNPKSIVNMNFYGGNCGAHKCSSNKSYANAQKILASSREYSETFEGMRLNHYYVKSLQDLQEKVERKNGQVAIKALLKRSQQWLAQTDSYSTADCLDGKQLSQQCCSNILQ